jgi:hypothetical protein
MVVLLVQLLLLELLELLVQVLPFSFSGLLSLIYVSVQVNQ